MTFLTEAPTRVKEKVVLDMWEHKGWGNNIDWTNYEKGRISGHLQIRLKVGDELRCKMQSGKIGRFKIVEHNQCYDPKDMFFATVKAVGYVGEPELEDNMSPFSWNVSIGIGRMAWSKDKVEMTNWKRVPVFYGYLYFTRGYKKSN